MRLKQFLYLQTVADAKSITKASQRLFVSHQAVSHALQSLERELQTQLFQRTPHGVTLTADGEYALSMARQILALNAELEKHFALKASQRPMGSLKIWGVSTLVSCILPQVQVRFIKEYPLVELELARHNAQPIMAALCQRQIDLGFLSMTRIAGQNELPLPPELLFTPLSRFKYCAVIGAASPLANYKTLSIKSLLRYPIIFLEEQINNDLDSYVPYRILSHYGQPQITIANSPALYCKLLSESMGVSVSVTDPLLAPALEQLSQEKTILYKPLRDHIDGCLGYLIHREQRHDPLIRCFLETLHDSYPQLDRTL